MHCGGMYTFTYVLEFGKELSENKTAFEKCKNNNYSLLVIRK